MKRNWHNIDFPAVYPYPLLQLQATDNNIPMQRCIKNIQVQYLRFTSDLLSHAKSELFRIRKFFHTVCIGWMVAQAEWVYIAHQGRTHLEHDYLSTQLTWMLLSSLYSWVGLNWLWGFMIDSLYNCSKIWRNVIHNIVINNFFSYVSNYVLLLNFLTFHKYQELKRIFI